MKRDMDVIRAITLETQALEPGYALHALDGVSQEVFAAHVQWMIEAGLVKGDLTEYMGNEPPKARVLRLTWAGCEFADAVADETIWKKAKQSVLKPSMSFTFDLLKDWLKAEITQGLPTLRGLAQ